MLAEGAADDAEGLGESVSLEAGDLPMKGRLPPSLFHPAFSCVAAAEICISGTAALGQAATNGVHVQRGLDCHVRSVHSLSTCSGM